MPIEVRGSAQCQRAAEPGYHGPIRSTMAKSRRAVTTSPAADRKDDGTQIERLRRLCLSIPGTMEKPSHGEPTFFTPNRVFAMFANNHHGDGHIAVWLPMGPGVQEALVEEAPEIYFRPPYVGVSGWIGVEMAGVDDRQLGSLIREAFNLIAAKERATGRRKAAAERRTGDEAVRRGSRRPSER
jgi:hypothetical protein